MTRPAGRLTGWMVALHWSRCTHCGRVIDRGDWQGLATVPGHGPRWVHEHCAAELGPLGDPRRPTHDRDIDPDTAPDTAPDSAPDRSAEVAGAVLRVLVIGSAQWPRERAVEVRDAIAAVARGHRRARLAHAARTHPDTGRLVGVDAWAELTATRLHLDVEHLAIEHLTEPTSPGFGAGERAAEPAGERVVDVVVAFPLLTGPSPAGEGEDGRLPPGSPPRSGPGCPSSSTASTTSTAPRTLDHLECERERGELKRERGELGR